MSDTDYPIALETAAFEGLCSHLRQAYYSKHLVLMDTNVQQCCWPILQPVLEAWDCTTIVVPAGEDYKTIATCQVIWQALLAARADRRSLLINLGGGVIGDMGGFCARTFKRGMAFIQVPTTLLSQVDASVGGKLGIDFGSVKNGVGLFHNPEGVYLYTGFFKTLPPDELLSGYAEMVKHALLQDQQPWRDLLPATLDTPTPHWDALVRASVAVKELIVAQDPLEHGLRKCLNLGHTIGHAIESLSWEHPNALLHGHAVAIGLLMECFLCCKNGSLPPQELEDIVQHLTQYYPYYPIQQLDKDAVWALIQQDKKNTHGQVAFSGLSRIGQPALNIALTYEDLTTALAFYQQQYGRQ